MKYARSIPSEIWVAIGRDRYDNEYDLAGDVAEAVRAERRRREWFVSFVAGLVIGGLLGVIGCCL